MSSFLYRAGWALARPLALPLGWGEGKLARAVRGRRGAAAAIRGWAAQHRDAARALVWFHAASVGEGRQAEAVLVRLREARPAWQILYTFASASAERFAGTLPADFAGYLPLDTVADTAAALEALQPSAIVFSATDVWPELVRQAARRRVALGLISATLAPTSSRRGPLARALLTGAYTALSQVGAIDEGDAGALVALGVPKGRVRVTGDTRHDAAAARAAKVDRRAPALAALGASGPPVVVAGSTWPADERVLLPALAEARRAAPVRLVIAPHEPTPAHLARLERRMASTLHAAPPVPPAPRVARLSTLEAAAGGQAWEVCLVDRVGVLADLYALAAVAFVGGGYHRAGLHSVIEPAALGVPVLFGPRWSGSRDARLLLQRGGARGAADSAALAAALRDWLSDDAARATAGAAARAVVEAGRGAADRSLQLVIELVETPSPNP